MMLRCTIWSLFAFGSGALPGHSGGKPRGSSPKARQSCDFDSAETPECWGEYDLSTNYYEDGPDTGVVREYWFDIVNGTAAPDGVERIMYTINGSFPGPTIYADWGDTVVVHVHNSLENNGTSLHFHGVRQQGSPDQDGVSSITQCPTAPGETFTYRWKASQYGASWYHSHYGLQAWTGVHGGIVINGPASAAYDEDLGILLLSDWFHQLPDQLYEAASTGGVGPPTATGGLINGTGVFGGRGSFFETTFVPGKRYRIRLVNTAIDSFFRFMIDDHILTVISTDFVPINPYETTNVGLSIGQRYDIIVEAKSDQTAHGAFWMRAFPVSGCSRNAAPDDVRGIVRYAEADGPGADTTVVPTTQPPDYDSANCIDEASSDLVPYLSLNAGGADYEDTFQLNLTYVGGYEKWFINDGSFVTLLNSPTLQQVIDGKASFNASQQVSSYSEADQWVYFVINNTRTIDHPIHMHGHDFWILAQGTGEFDPDTELDVRNVPRRDVAMLNSNGHLVIGFITDNPGAWLIHCHIGWHASQGLAWQVIERASDIPSYIDTEQLEDTCSTWNSWAAKSKIPQDPHGSGI